ncbi:hypothetical protein ACTMTI_49075 [Nonomuraea sp. H19]|uniref:hypothetical protein n=1 Tax=Nonomuraea sp. H19 TaxID=3452206 RepID=UPI003F8A03F1
MTLPIQSAPVPRTITGVPSAEQVGVEQSAEGWRINPFAGVEQSAEGWRMIPFAGEGDE